MKKYLALLLVVLMAVTVFAACDESADQDRKDCGHNR